VNVDDYMASGILEMYVLGLCSVEERSEVDSLLKVHPELILELRRIEDSVENYALSNAMEPSASLKSRVMSSLEGDKGENVVQSSPLAIASDNSKRFNWSYLAAACFVLLVASASVNVILMQRYNNTKEALMAIETQNSQLAQELNAKQASFQEVFSALQIVNDTSVRIVRMKGLPLSPQSMATIYWNRSSDEVYLSVNSLPTPPAGKQYQLWAIVGDTPIDAGVFDIQNSSELQRMKSFDDAAAFAVTLEPAGGSVSPTMEQMIVVAAL